MYEVWCEVAAESVFIDHKPSKEELGFIRDEQNWKLASKNIGRPCKLRVYKLDPFYGNGNKKGA
jgi:hypothetical protein